MYIFSGTQEQSCCASSVSGSVTDKCHQSASSVVDTDQHSAVSVVASADDKAQQCANRPNVSSGTNINTMLFYGRSSGRDVRKKSKPSRYDD